MTFPAGFLFGAATSAYQIEGAVAEDGRAPSIWDTFAHTPGAVANGETGDVAVDHYHRWPEDVRLMADLGIGAYGLSISWSRVQPRGRGPLNPAGVAFYRDLLDALTAEGIAPLVTLHHWDLPQALQDEGGWAVRSTAQAFAGYARAMAGELGSRVHLWFTVNEPWCVAFQGNASGVHAPGHRDPAEALAAAHHLSLAHGLAAAAIRAELGQEARVGVVLNLHVTRPADELDSTHLEAVRSIDLVGNHIFLGPLLDGSYPPDLKAATRHLTDWSFVLPGDLTTTRQRLDVLGVDYCASNTVRPGAGGTGPGDGAASPWVGAEGVEFLRPVGDTTAVGWNIDPEGLHDLLRALDNVYPEIPLMVTGNGAAFDDVVVDGQVHDARRIDYLAAHLAQVERAVGEGIDVRGYVVRSLLDSFEWERGYDPRFGLVRVEPGTLERVPKDSARWYAGVIAGHRAAHSPTGPEPAAPGRSFLARLWRRAPR